MSKITRITLITELLTNIMSGIVCLTDTDDKGAIRRAYYTGNADFVNYHGGAFISNTLIAKNQQHEDSDEVARPFVYNILSDEIEQITPSQFTGFVHYVASFKLMSKEDIEQHLFSGSDFVCECFLEDCDCDFEYDCDCECECDTPSSKESSQQQEATLLDFTSRLADIDGNPAVVIESGGATATYRYAFMVTVGNHKVLHHTNDYGVNALGDQVIFNLMEEEQEPKQEDLLIEEKDGYILLRENEDPIWLDKDAKLTGTLDSDKVFPVIAQYVNNRLFDIVILAN